MNNKNDNYFRPLEIVHDFNFIPCNLPQDAKMLSPKERIDHLKALGYGGVVISPSFKDYLSDESIAEAAEFIKYANEQGLLVWIYDEMYYPSGSAGGIVPREHPEYEAKGIAVLTVSGEVGETVCINSPHGYSGVIAAYYCKLNANGKPDFKTLTNISDKKNFGGGIVFKNNQNCNICVFAFFGKAVFEFATTSHNTRTLRRYIDTLNPNAVYCFLHTTYDKYENYTDGKKLGDLIEGVFSDEMQIPALCRINYIENYRDWAIKNQNGVFTVYDLPDSDVAFTPYIPWTESLEKEFKEKYGYDLLPKLPLLFFDEGENGKKVRADFWELVSDIFSVSYNETYNNFRKENNVVYTGHFLYEEDFENHPYMHGDLLKQLGKMPLPGCDYLYATPSGILKNAASAKFAASAASLYGNDECMCEVSNMCKDIMPITAPAHCLATALEMTLGITRFFSYYTDFSMPDAEIKRCTDFTFRLTKKLADMKPVRKCALYVPNRTIMEETFPAFNVKDKKEYSKSVKTTVQFMNRAAETLIRGGIDFIFINDECLEKLAAGYQSGSFNPKDSVLIIPPFVKLPENLTKDFRDTVFAEDLNTLCELLQKYDLRCVSSHKNLNLIVLHKQNDKKDAYLLVNTDDEDLENVVVNHKGNTENIYVYDPHTDTTLKINSPTLSIPQKQARILFVEK